MVDRRSYGDPCGIARALDLLGERWGLLVVRELMLGPKRFTDLRTELPGLSPDVLAQRLRGLERTGIVRRLVLPSPARARVYELSDWGRELEPVILALGRWGSRAPFPRIKGQLSVDAFVIALKTLFNPTSAAGLTGAYELRLGDQTFHARVAGRRLELKRASGDLPPDAIIESDTRSLSAVLWHGRRLSEARSAGDVRIEGSRSLVDRFLKLFPPARPAVATG